MARHVISRIDPWLYRVTGGRYPASLDRDRPAPADDHGCEIGSAARSTNSPTSTMGRDPILIASNYGGTETPAVVLQPEGAP